MVALKRRFKEDRGIRKAIIAVVCYLAICRAFFKLVAVERSLYDIFAILAPTIDIMIVDRVGHFFNNAARINSDQILISVSRKLLRKRIGIPAFRAVPVIMPDQRVVVTLVDLPPLGKLIFINTLVCIIHIQ